MIPSLLARRSLERSFVLSTTLLVIVLIGTTMVLVRSRVATTLYSSLETRAVSLARNVGAAALPALVAGDRDALRSETERGSVQGDVLYVVIHDRHGKIAARTPGAPVALHTIPTAGALDEEGQSIRAPYDPSKYHVSAVSGSDGGRVLEVSVPVVVDGVPMPWGTVCVGLSFEPVARELSLLTTGLLLLGFVLGLAAVLYVRWAGRQITAPLRRLAAGTEALAVGDTSHRFPVTGPVELADLARAFNVMTDRLDRKGTEAAEFQRALESLNATLEQQVAERTRELAESEAQYKSLVENSPDAILILQDGRLWFVNPAFAQTFGVPEGEALAAGFDIARLFDPSSLEMVLERIAAWERGEAQGPVEVLGRDGRGGVRHLELRGSRIEYRGRPAAECLLIDRTEAVRLREELGQTEKLRALGELAGGVAHDFNNLLGAILGRTQLLRRRLSDPSVDRDLSVVEKAAQDGRETVRRIQEFSRLRRDRKVARVDLAEVVGDAVEITRTRWKSEAERRNVAIDLDTETEDVPSLLGSDSELREVFTNLILNAVDAMPQGGRLTLRCRQRDDRIVAEVEDTGVGMTEEIRKQIFDPFFTTKGQQGTGLGMSVVYGIVTRHGGTIDVDSALGRGTLFRLSFPVAQPSLIRDEDESHQAPVISRPGRILVIDDERDIGELLEEVLAAEGHTVDLARCGREGVDRARLSRYDLVFTDLSMPDMSGWEVASEIHESSPDLPVILVTGWGASLDREKARERGIFEILHKPFEISDLVRTAAGAIALRRAEAEEISA